MSLGTNSYLIETDPASYSSTVGPFNGRDAKVYVGAFEFNESDILRTCFVTAPDDYDHSPSQPPWLRRRDSAADFSSALFSKDQAFH